MFTEYKFTARKLIDYYGKFNSDWVYYDGYSAD